MRKFKQMPQCPDQVILFPISVDSAVPEESDVRAISEVMDALDWSGIVASYSSDGCPAYPPYTMTKILVYAYLSGVRSSRKIEALVENDKRYMWLSGGLTPDFHTIARFRRDKWDHLVELFADTARLCRDAGLVSFSLVSIDGSKTPGAGSRKSVYDSKRIERERQAIEQMLGEAEEADREEDELHGSGNGRSLPKELAKADERRKRIERAAQLLRESKRDRVSVTDPESRQMKTRWGVRSSYNLQAAVDSDNQVIVGMDVVQAETDYRQLVPMMEKVEETLGRPADLYVADSGYCDEEALLALESSGKEALLRPQESNREKAERLFRNECFIHEPERDVLICPAGHELCFKRIHKASCGTYRVYSAKGCQSCSFYMECAGGKSSRSVWRSIVFEMRQKMRNRLKTEQGRKQYSTRSQTVEPVFGQAKSNRKLDRFLLFGLKGVTAECAIAFAAHNIRKCASLLSREDIKSLKTKRTAASAA
jgi:transposase